MRHTLPFSKTCAPSQPLVLGGCFFLSYMEGAGMDGLRLVLGDSIEEMDKLPEKSVNLIVCDPPYNISKADWDKFKADEYIDYMGKVFNACHRVLADNGVLYWFHSDMAQVSRLMEKIREDGQFSYNSFITLDKGDWRAQAWKNPSKDNNLRSWFNTCEYLLCYTNKASTHTEWDKTGWDRVRLDTDHFTTLRKYAYDVLLFIGGATTRPRISTEYSDIDTQNTSSIVSLARRRVFDCVGGKADHFMRYGSTQWSLPTAETYSELIDVFKINEMEGFREYEDLRREYEDLRREYEDLRREYEDLRPVHNLDANHKNVWEFRRDKGRNWHSCQKPQDILTRIINTSSKPGATVLDPFMGSGSTAIACLSTGREFIGIENDQETYNLANERIQEVLSDEDTNNSKSTPGADD